MQIAKTPNMDFLTKNGITGGIKSIPDGFLRRVMYRIYPFPIYDPCRRHSWLGVIWDRFRGEDLNGNQDCIFIRCVD